MTPAQIKKHRTKAGITQAQLGAVLGVSTNTVARWEQGATRPSLRALTALRQLFEGSQIDSWASHQADILSLQSNPPPSRGGVSAASLLQGLTDLQRAGDACGVRVVAIGAVAMGAHGFPRATKDFDVIGPTRDDAECFVEQAKRVGFSGSHVPQITPKGPPMPFLALSWSKAMVRKKPMGVEAFLREGFLDHVSANAGVAQTKFGPLRVAALEDVVVLKLAAWREKDQLDVLWILSDSPGLNCKYVASWAKRLGVEENWEEALLRSQNGDAGW